jgi:hypothetical protein
MEEQSMGLKQDTKDVTALVKRVRRYFSGQSAHVQGAALANLLATWLARHVEPDHPEETKRLREELLEMHLVTVRALIDINYRMDVEPQIKAGAARGTGICTARRSQPAAPR